MIGATCLRTQLPVSTPSPHSKQAHEHTTQTTTNMLAEINNYLFISLHMKQLEHSTHATSMLPMT